MKQALFHAVTLLAKVKRQFVNHKDIYIVVKSILDLYSLEHEKNLMKLSCSK